MNQDGFERVLAERFQRLRSEDDRITPAPSFRALYGAARRAAPRRRGRDFFLIAAAAAVFLVIGVLLFRRPADPARSLPAADAKDIAEWRSPTESLLGIPGSEIYGEAPSVVDPIPRWIFESKPRTSSTPRLSTPAPKGVSS